MEKAKEIGKFYAVSHNDVSYTFSVRDDKTILLEKVDDGGYLLNAINKPVETIDIAPRIILYEKKDEIQSREVFNRMSFESFPYEIIKKYRLDEEGLYRFDSSNDPKHLIKEFSFDEGVFEYLKENNMIHYSTDMAYLYNFVDKEGFDYDNKKGKPYKHAIKKGKVLEN